MKATVLHLNSLDCELDRRQVGSADEKLFQQRIKSAILDMVEENVIDPGDKFVVVEVA